MQQQGNGERDQGDTRLGVQHEPGVRPHASVHVREREEGQRREQQEAVELRGVAGDPGQRDPEAEESPTVEDAAHQHGGAVLRRRGPPDEGRGGGQQSVQGEHTGAE